MEYSAWVVKEQDGAYIGGVESLTLGELAADSLRVQVSYSSLNYKDALSATGNKGVTRQYPHTPGIDAVGTVTASTSNSFREGDVVIVTGYDLGMNTAGGFGEYIDVPAAWAVSLPKGLTQADAMRLGTAGLTAGLCVQSLIEKGNLDCSAGERVAVTGSTGGVGSIAVALLAKLGAEVTAISGKSDAHDYLRTLGTNDLVDSSAYKAEPPPITKPVWHGSVDTVGGNPLQHLLAATLPSRAVSCCGMVAGMTIPASIFPFILRGVALLGIDSVEISLAEKAKIWNLFSADWDLSSLLPKMTKEVTLGNLQNEIDTILKGGQVGRILVKV